MWNFSVIFRYLSKFWDLYWFWNYDWKTKPLPSYFCFVFLSLICWILQDSSVPFYIVRRGTLRWCCFSMHCLIWFKISDYTKERNNTTSWIELQCPRLNPVRKQFKYHLPNRENFCSKFFKKFENASSKYVPNNNIAKRLPNDVADSWNFCFRFRLLILWLPIRLAAQFWDDQHQNWKVNRLMSDMVFPDSSEYPLRLPIFTSTADFFWKNLRYHSAARSLYS